jgi:hypothetical protein
MSYIIICMEFIKKHFTILLAFLLPIGLIIFVALSIYIPSFFLPTNYNFVYVICSDVPYSKICDYKDDYSIRFAEQKIISGRLEKELSEDGYDIIETILDPLQEYKTNIFLHDVKKNTSREITIEEAQKLSIAYGVVSPDELFVHNRYHNYGGVLGFYSGGGSPDEYYLTDGKARRKLNIFRMNEQQDGRNFSFVGWVVEK